MSQIPSLINNATKSTSQPFGAHNTLNDLDLDVFLKLMIKQMQSQDPLNPMDNDQMLNQISQLRSIGATDKLTSTLDSVLLGQNISSSTGLIGKDVKAISDDNQPVAGTVTRVTIEDGKPKLQLDLNMKAEPSIEKGDVGKGKYGYRIVWQGDDGTLQGVELAGDQAIDTTSSVSNYQSIQLRNLPVTKSAKQIYRTDNSGSGDYRLVTTIPDGSQSSYLDTSADNARSETRQTLPFVKSPSNQVRNFKVSLSNVSEVVDHGA
jgi:flagellar basal-body rod modification protein FlgD